MIRIHPVAVLSAAALAALTACGGSSTADSTSATTPSTTASAHSPALATASTSLAKIVVDGTGMSVYVYDKDTKGASASACTGACLSAWPPVEVSGTPDVSGVTGTVATITAPDGGKQVTLDGWPLYTYAGDSGPGDVNGQASQGVWWAVSPSGTKITTAAGSTGSTGSTGGGHGY